MRRPLATILAAFVLAVALLVLPGAPVGAQDADTTTTSAVPTQDIIPRPNTGVEPSDAGDRGGSLQTALFVGIIVAIVGGGAWVVVQSRKARADRGF